MSKQMLLCRLIAVKRMIVSKAAKRALTIIIKEISNA